MKMLSQKLYRFFLIQSIFIVPLLFNASSHAQIEVRICPVNRIPATKEFSGHMTVTNNTGVELHLDQGQFTYEWGNLVSLQWPFDQYSASGDSRTFRMNLAYPYIIPDGGTDGDDFNGKYEGTLTIPASGTYTEGGTTYDVTVTHCAKTEEFELYDSDVEFNRNCFIYSEETDLCLGEAATEIWGGEGVRDVMIPVDRPSWAIGVMVAHRLFINMTGVEDMISPHFWMATGLNESAMGCDGTIVPNRQNHCYLTSANHACEFDGIGDASKTTSDNCFQILAYIQLQLNQPDLFDQSNAYGTTNSANVVGGGNWETGAIGVTYYHYQNMQYWKSIAGQDVWQLAEDSQDPYFLEKFFYHAFHDGFNAGKALLDDIYADYANAVAATNMNDVIAGSGTWPSNVYGSLKVANFTSLLDGNGVIYDQQKSDHTTEYYGCYDADLDFDDVLYYLNEVKILYPHLMDADVQAEIKAVFDGINGGADVPFSKFGPIIDEIVIQMGGHDPSKFLATQYGGSTTYDDQPVGVALRTDEEGICPGEEAVLQVWLAGDPNFSVEILYPDGSVHSFTDIDGSPYYITVDQPGIYEVLNYSDADEAGRVNCNFGKVTIPSNNSSIVNWDKSNLDQDLGCATGDLIINKSGDNEVVVSYTFNGGAPTDVALGATNYVTTVLSNAPAGNYEIVGMTPNECNEPINDALTICATETCTMPTNPALTVAPSTSVCDPQTIELTATADPGATAFQYTFYDANGVVQAASTDNTFTVGQSGDYYVVVSDPVDANTCTATSGTESLEINTSPVVNVVTADLSYCAGGVDLEVTDVAGATYSWVGQNQGLMSDTDPVLNSATEDIYTVEVVANGCSTTINNIEVTQSTLGSLNISGEENPACGSTETYTVTGGDLGSSYVWSLPSGATGNSTTNSIDITFGSSNGTISVYEDQGGGCTGNPVDLAVTQVGCSLSADFEADVTSICAGDTVTFTNLTSGAVSATYNWDFADGVSLTGTTGEGPHQVVFSTGGDKEIGLTVTEGVIVSEVKTDYISVNNYPNKPEISGATEVCEGETSQYVVSNAGSGTYAWTLPSEVAGSSSGTTNDLTFNSSGPIIDISASVTENGCSVESDVFSVQINSLPDDPGAILGNTSLCEGNVETYSVGVANGATSYNWTSPSGLTGASISNSIDLTATGLTGGTISVTASNSCGESNSASLDVFIGGTPEQSAAIINPDLAGDVCVGTSVEYTLSGVTGANQFDWTIPSNGNIVSGQGSEVLVVEWTADGAGNLSVIPSSTCGNGTPIPLNVTVLDVPENPVGIIGSDDVCANSSESYAVDMDGAIADSYNWSATGATINGDATGESVSVDVAGSGFTLEVEAVNSCGASGLVSKNVSVGNNLQPTVSLLNPGSVCEGAETTINANIGTAGQNPTIEWRINNTLQSSSSTSLTANLSDGDEVSILVVSDASCKDPLNDEATDQITISTVVEPIAGDITSSAGSELCEGDITQLSITSVTNADDYTWVSTADGILLGSGNSVQFEAGVSGGTLAVTPLNSQCFPTGGQSAELELIINTKPSDEGVITGSTEVCEDVEITFATSAVSGANTYSWSGGNLVSQSGLEAVIRFDSPGAIVSVSASNDCGTTVQSNTLSVNTTSDISPELLLVASNTNGVYCENETVRIEAVVTPNSPALAEWTLVDQPLSDTDLDIEYSAQELESGELAVNVEVTGACGNVLLSEKLDLVLDKSATIDLSDTEITLCEGELISVTNNGKAVNHSWTLNGVEISSDNPVQVTSADEMDGTVVLTANNANSCPDVRGEVDLLVLKLPQMSFVNSSGNAVETYVAVEESTVDVYVNETQGKAESSFDFEWQFSGSGISIPFENENNAQYIGESEGVYEIVSRSWDKEDVDKQCISIVKIPFEVVAGLKIPNTFTPNGDAINDSWELTALSAYPDAIVRIFNRWGEELETYTGDYSDLPWDGTKNGQPLPVGTYYYVIQLNDPVAEVGEFSGWVNIVR
jgi:gliding motility-associated-like protein